MTLLSRNARIAGLWYLLIVIFGPVRLLYVPNKLFVHADARATAANIVAHPLLFQFGIAADLGCAVVLIFLALAFYRLFKDVDLYQAVLLVITGGILPSALYFVNTINDTAALRLVEGGEYLDVFSEAQRDALAYFFTRLHFDLIVSAEVLWGVWLFPMAILILKSRWFPRFLGWWLILNGITYLVLSYAGMFMPDRLDVISNWAFPFQLGEVALVLWLLVMGAREKRSVPPVAAAVTSGE
jgi:Domain of unknown function (DUF4386)